MLKPDKTYQGCSTIRMYSCDCLKVMPEIEDKSIDMVLCDLPYGKTKCDWDTKINLVELWNQYGRIVKDNGAIILTATQPFTSELVISNKKLFKYELIWDKVSISSPALAKRQPLRAHENILVFYKEQPKYNPVMRDKSEVTGRFGGIDENDSPITGYLGENQNRQVGYPKSILEFLRPNNLTNDKAGYHPTQKPIDLFRYLIKTYTDEGDTVLDNCMGSGTTLIACYEENRGCIGIELDKDYFNAAVQRFENHIAQQKLF